MAPAPEVASKDFLMMVDQLWTEKRDIYTASPFLLVKDINEKYANKKAFVCLHSSEVTPGYLVSARCMVQNTLSPEFFPLACTVSGVQGTYEATGFMRDSFGDDVTEIFDHGKHWSRYCYKMVMVPGASDWWLNDFIEAQTTVACRTQNEVESSAAAKKITKFIAKVVDDGTPELKPNTVVDVYGYLSGPVLREGQGEPETDHHSVHVICLKEVCCESSSSEREFHVLRTIVPQRLRCNLVKEISSLLGSTTAADLLINFLVSTTFSRPGGTPLCFLPLNIVGVTDCGIAESVIHLVQHLKPKVKILDLTPDLLSKKRFAPFKDYESDDLIQGELQLSNGTVLIIDETHLPEGAFPVSGFVKENLKVLEELVVDHKISYDYGFYKIPMEVDYNVLVLSVKESRFFRTPFRIPILTPTSSFLVENVEEKRTYLEQCRSAVSSIKLCDEVSKEIQDSFVNMCASLDLKTDKAELLNELLILSRLVASSNGGSSVELEHWEHAVQISKANAHTMSVWKSR